MTGGYKTEKWTLISPKSSSGFRKKSFRSGKTWLLKWKTNKPSLFVTLCKKQVFLGLHWINKWNTNIYFSWQAHFQSLSCIKEFKITFQCAIDRKYKRIRVFSIDKRNFILFLHQNPFRRICEKKNWKKISLISFYLWI